MKPTILGIVIVLALIASGAIFFAGAALNPVAPAALPEQLYSNDRYGISFSFPSGYLLSEQEEDSVHRITLIQEADAVPVVAGGEGPVAITVDAFPLPAGMNLDAWVRGMPESNFALGPGVYAETTVDDVPAARYSWSGLYEGETIAFVHKDRVFMLSVTFMSPADQIRVDFETLLASLRLR